ncbi:MAG: SGNH/GDSL hydrolase family protein [Rikenellaceae bacterium]
MERRNFIKQCFLAGLSVSIAPQLINAAENIKNYTKQPAIKLKQDDVILFQGDSITDCYRGKSDPKVNDSTSLGIGYTLYTATGILADYPKLNLQIHNRGISGNRTDDLLRRWQSECIDLKPTVLSLLVGVNDYLHVFKHNYKGTVVEFRQYYTELLERTVEALPNTKLIIGEPFYIRDASGVPDNWKNIYTYQDVVRELANSYNALFIPYQSEFDELCKEVPVKYWTPDSIHPGLAGRYAMAKIWRKYTGI